MSDTARRAAVDPAEVPWLLAEEGKEQSGDAAPVTAEEGTGGHPATAEAPAESGARPLRHNRDFRLLWGGAGLSLLAGRATAVAYPLTVLWATGSPGDAGLVGTALLLPQLVMQLPGGALVDRWDRRRVMVAAGLGQALVTGLVVALLLSGRTWLWALLVAAFAEGTLGVLHQLAERAAVPSVVPAEQLPAALTGNEARTRGAAIAGQPLGSGLIGLATALPYAAAAVVQLASVICLFGIRGRLQQQRAAPPARLGTEIREGLVWMWRQPFLRAVMTAVAVTNVLFQGLNLAVMTGIQDRHGTQFEVGLVLSLSGAGGLVGALTGGWWQHRLRLRTLVLGGLLAWTALMAPVAAALHTPVLLGALFAASGYVGGVFNVAGGVLLVRAAPDRMRGRANSLANLVGSGAMAAGPVAAGFLLEATGAVRSVLALSAVMALTAVCALLSPGLRKAPYPESESPA
ncbi:MFS transporter [Streptomyces sp. NPDC101151]|uniref:MFS transporter n=1 Tax=Streptomyces sp. NPDC101151 TaxID=3366115 RepID=UPI0037FC566E